MAAPPGLRLSTLLVVFPMSVLPSQAPCRLVDDLGRSVFGGSFTRPIWRPFLLRSFRQRATLAGNSSCSKGSAVTSQQEGGGVRAASGSAREGRLCAVGAHLATRGHRRRTA